MNKGTLNTGTKRMEFADGIGRYIENMLEESANNEMKKKTNI